MSKSIVLSTTIGYHGSNVYFTGRVHHLRNVLTRRNGYSMAVFYVDTDTDVNIGVIALPRKYTKFSKLLNRENALLSFTMRADFDTRHGLLQFFLESVELVSDVSDNGSPDGG